mgnify:CR=1 FL=1
MTDLLTRLVLKISENRIQNCLHGDVLEYEGPWDKINNEPTVLQRYMAIGFKTQHDRKD